MAARYFRSDDLSALALAKAYVEALHVAQPTYKPGPEVAHGPLRRQWGCVSQAPVSRARMF